MIPTKASWVQQASNRTLFDLNNIDIERKPLLSVPYIAIPSNWTSKPKLSCQSSPSLKKEAGKLFPTKFLLRTEDFKDYEFSRPKSATDARESTQLATPSYLTFVNKGAIIII
jgi:hypothetical protein